MTANIQQELEHIIEQRSRATQLNALFQGYKLYARTEGKSENTIRITGTALSTLKAFLGSKGYPDDVTKLGINELRTAGLYNTLFMTPHWQRHQCSSARGEVASMR